MTDPTEVELKLRVDDEAALDAIAAAAEARGAERAPAVAQENHFYDTADLALRARDATLRLREEAGRFLLAAKGPARVSADDVLHTRVEIEAELDAATARAVLRGEADPFACLEQRQVGGESGLLRELRALLAGTGLVHVGSFRNLRTRVGPLGIGDGRAFLELDRTELPGGRVDHEVELEVAPADEPEARRLLARLFDEAGVRGRPGTSKAQRFFQALEGV